MAKGSGVQTEVHPDVGGSAELEGCRVYQRVEKIVRVNYPYTLNTNNQYAPFPDMSIPFYLAFDQFVKIHRNIQFINGGGYLVTRVRIDGTEDPDFRINTGDTVSHSHVLSDEVWLAKGKHTVVV